MKKLNLQMYAGSLTVTVYKDAGITTASASPASSLAKDDEVALTITPASGYELDAIDVVSGGVTLTYDEDDGWGFVMGEADVVLNVKSKGDNIYKIVEDTPVWVNGTSTKLSRNMMLERANNGAVVGVTCEGTAVTLGAEIVAELVKAGVLIKM